MHQPPKVVRSVTQTHHRFGSVTFFIRAGCILFSAVVFGSSDCHAQSNSAQLSAPIQSEKNSAPGPFRSATNSESETISLDDLAVPATGTVDTEKLHKQMASFVRNVHVYRDLSRIRRATLEEKPIFRWANPERKSVAGNLFLWTVQGRPQAMMGIWCVRGKAAGYEIQSCSESGFTVELPDQAWTASQRGLKFAELSTPVPPAGSPARRDFQARQILQKRFRAEITKSGRKNAEKLRLLPKPVYTYAKRPAGVISGAMYSFAMGTDPEALVVIEARQEADEAPKWFYAFVPSTIVEVHGYLDDQLVFESNLLKKNPGTFLRGF